VLSFQLLDIPLSILFKKCHIFLFDISLSPTENNCLLEYDAIYPQSVAGSSKTLVHIYWATQHHIPEELPSLSPL
jgi:hypothetical protein